MRILTLLLLAPLCSPALALETDKDKPLDVTSDRFEGGPNDAVSVLTGNVHLTQGTIVGTGDRADIHQKDKAVSKVVLTGAPATLKQDLEGGGRMDAKARSIDYDVNARRAVLTGNAVVVHPRGEARGEHLTYDVATGKMSGDGQGGSGRVNLHFVPQSAEEKAAEKAKEEAAKKADAAKKPAPDGGKN